MAGIPSTICQLRKNKFIGNQRGFVDSFNWVAQSLYNLKGGDGIDINWQDGTHPEISLTDELSSQADLSVEGTNGSVATTDSSYFVLSCAEDSWVKISCDGNVLTFGVYYV